MSKPALDDLEAIRTIVQALEGFGPSDQERILRWVREKIGLQSAVFAPPPLAGTPSTAIRIEAPSPDKEKTPDGRSGAMDIKSFVQSKNPQSDIQFTATVAYYYRFEAPENERKASVTAEDLQEATRKVGRERLAKAAQTLINAHQQGVIDKAGERGAYAINTVGENLVAMALPNGSAPSSPRTRRTQSKKRSASKKSVSVKKKK